MTITIFVDPNCLTKFLEIAQILKDLEIENSYIFNPSDIDFTDKMVSNWIWINIDIVEYLKLKYCVRKMYNKM